MGRKGRKAEDDVIMRRTAIARRFPEDYVEYRNLADPVRCSHHIEIFEETARKCAGLYEKNGECNLTREMFFVCESIKKEIEDLQRPIVAAEAELEKYKRDAFAAEKAKRDAIAAAEKAKRDAFAAAAAAATYF